jgi:phosphomannomutase
MEYMEKNLIKDNRISAGANTDMVPEFSATLGAVYGTFLKNKGVVVLARDYRTDSRMLKRSFAAGLMSAGVNILDIHAASISILRFTIRRFGANGGVMFTAGHLHKGKTTIKFYDAHGIEYGIDFIENLITSVKNKKIIRVSPEEIGQISTSEDVNSIYHKSMRQFIDKELISKSNLRVVMDCANGPVGDVAPPLFSSLDMDVIAINTFVPYKALKLIPSIESIRKMSRIIASADADFGIATDVDATKAIFFDETGAVIDSDLLMTLFFMDLLKKDIKKPRVITSQTTTKILEELANKYDVKLIRVDNIPGEISKAIRLKMGNLGISDGGKIRFPMYAPFTDIILVALKLSEIIAKSDQKLSTLISRCPQTIKMQEDILVEPEVFYNYHVYLNKIQDKVEKIIDVLFGAKIYFGKDIGFITITPQLYFDRLRLSAELIQGCDASELFEMVKASLLEK